MSVELNPLALEALENNQRQIDMDGVEVGVSRQALDELITAYKALAAQPAREAQEAVAWRDVLAERQRQIETEGWTPDRDDAHQSGELADAAALYASIKVRHVSGMAVWPWEPEWFKPTSGAVPGSRRRDIVKACALLLAEIERLDRLSALTQLEARDVG